MNYPTVPRSRMYTYYSILKCKMDIDKYMFFLMYLLTLIALLFLYKHNHIRFALDLRQTWLKSNLFSNCQSSNAEFFLELAAKQLYSLAHIKSKPDKMFYIEFCSLYVLFWEFISEYCISAKLTEGKKCHICMHISISNRQLKCLKFLWKPTACQLIYKKSYLNTYIKNMTYVCN